MGWAPGGATARDQAGPCAVSLPRADFPATPSWDLDHLMREGGREGGRESEKDREFIGSSIPRGPHFTRADVQGPMTVRWEGAWVCGSYFPGGPVVTRADGQDGE